MSELQLTPLGTSPAWYNPGEPASGHLLEAGGARVLVDCGSGVIARYLELRGADAPIDAIVISHTHADHVFDLVPLKYGIEYGGLGSWKPQLWLPPHAHERLQRMASAWDGPATFFSSTYEVHEYEPGTDFTVGPLECSSVEVPHFIESFALRFDHAGASFGFSADLGPCDQIVDLMNDVDLLLCEATLAESSDEPADARGHLSGGEAGDIARRAGARSLLLTHVPESAGREHVLQQARAAYGGPVQLAQSGSCYPIAQRLAQVG